MGGDVGLPVTIPAALAFAQQFPATVLHLVGRQDEIARELEKHHHRFPSIDRDRLEILHASEVVTMEDSVEIALRRKKDSSMRVAAQAVKEGRAQAFVSAGNTGRQCRLLARTLVAVRHHGYCPRAARAWC